MRRFVLGGFLSMALLVPKVGIAQVYLLPTPTPGVSAASVDWLRSGAPIFYNGSWYYPTGPVVFFDGNVMSSSGSYEGVPLYADSTIEPYSIVYVPIGRGLLRPYERRREGQLVGTVGARMPSFPIQRDSELSLALWRTAAPVLLESAEPLASSQAAAAPGPTAGCCTCCCCCQPGATAAAAPAAPAATTPNVVESVPPPSGPNGIWLEYDGGRWYSDGTAVQYDASRFMPIGSYRGVPVYRDRSGAQDRIYVTVVPDGPLAPFARR